ncbi:FprA family A-type flavoprotein [Pseudoramibacter alactolyticus]|nr:FprA family A-type flavoprotein [Pseudoramibacter alactolyticus]
MHHIRKVTDDLYWIGANDRRTERFENIHPIPEGVSYNAYMLLDEKTVLFDTVDWSCGRQFFDNVEAALNGRPLDYVIVHHVEPDHAATLGELLLHYPNARVIGTAKAKQFLTQFSTDVADRFDAVKNGDSKSFGRHEIHFVAAPMVHWPEVMVSFDSTNGVLFSADAFGSFKALDGKLFADEVNFDRDWIDEARRYYTNIVGKYGKNVQGLLKKTAALDIRMICPLHGLIWRKNLSYFIDKHDKWSRYEPESKGVLVVYASMYGDTEQAADILAGKLVENGVTDVRVFDISKTDKSYLISEAFRLSHLVLASCTYNLHIYPPMDAFITDMKMLALSGRTVSVIENGTWAIKAGTLIEEKLAAMKDMKRLENKVTIQSSVSTDNKAALDALADAIAADINKH